MQDIRLRNGGLLGAEGRNFGGLFAGRVLGINTFQSGKEAFVLGLLGLELGQLVVEVKNGGCLALVQLLAAVPGLGENLLAFCFQ